jgi:hypothetical protein
MANPRFERALRMLRSPDPEAGERGFDFLREHADAFVGDLMAAFETEADQGLRCLLLELVAEARSAAALPVLAGQLDSEDDDLRLWAVRGLEMLDSREANRLLEQAEADGQLL